LTPLACALLSHAALAQAAPEVSAAVTQLAPVIVSANRWSQPLAEVLSESTVIDRDTLSCLGAGSVADVLARVPGFEMARNGGPGTSTSLFLRGGDARFVAVLIDGVRIDTQSVSGGATWAAMPLAQIERIEVVRGPASAAYGSDAISGVVQIITRQATAEGVALSIGTGFGSQATRQQDASLQARNGPLSIALSVGHEQSEGYNGSRATRVGANPDLDGYERQTMSARAGLKLSEDHNIELSALVNRVDSQYDGGTSRTTVLTADDHNHHRLDVLNAVWRARVSERWTSRLSTSLSRDRYSTEPSPYLTLTQIRAYAWLNEGQLDDSGALRWDATAERREDGLSNSSLTISPTRGVADRSQNSLGAGISWRGENGLALQARARHDADSEFGGHNSGSLAAGVDIGSGWRATSSWGTAFRAPTLFQRYSIYGNPDLKPETSRELDIGLAWRSGADRFSATAYRNQVSNLLTFGAAGICSSTNNCYRNTAQARLQGLTLSGETLLAAVKLSGSLDLQSPRDASTGKLLARRAQRHAQLRAELPAGDWNLGAEWQASSSRFDYVSNPAGTRLPGYALVNLDAQLPLSLQWQLNLRVDNAFNRAHDTAYGYASAPRSAFVGVRWNAAL
jgi:vitamin B12 transporter